MRQNCFDINRKELLKMLNMNNRYICKIGENFVAKLSLNEFFFIKWSVGELAHAGTGSAE